MTRIGVVDRVGANVNVRNVTDTKHLGSLKWCQAFYGAPRSLLFALSFDY